MKTTLDRIIKFTPSEDGFDLEIQYDDLAKGAVRGPNDDRESDFWTGAKVRVKGDHYTLLQVVTGGGFSGSGTADIRTSGGMRTICNHINRLLDEEAAEDAEEYGDDFAAARVALEQEGR